MHKNHLKKIILPLEGFFSVTLLEIQDLQRNLSLQITPFWVCSHFSYFDFSILNGKIHFFIKLHKLQTKNHLLSITPGAQLWLPPPPLLQEGPLLLSWASQLTLQVFVASHFHLHSLHFENFPSKQISFWQELWTSVSRGLASSRVEEPEQNDQEVFRSAV